MSTDRSLSQAWRQWLPSWPVLVAAGLLLAATGSWLWWRQRPMAVALDMLAINGVASDPTARYTGELFLADRPRSRIHLMNLFGLPNPAQAAGPIAALKRQGVRFFISTQPSTYALRSLGEFSRGDALVINTAAASNRLSGRDDYFLRVVPDVRQEQQAIADALQRLPGHRLLVLQDTNNPGYTEAALASFRAALAGQQRWQITVRPILVSGFDPQRERSVMAGNVDGLYILAGQFQPAIGNISQLFHQLHPQAPILLTPWARSPAIAANAGPARSYILQVSPYPPRQTNRQVNAYLQRFERRYGFTPNAMAIGLRQSLELLDRALASGAQTPTQVKRFLLDQPEHNTSFGPIRFDANGDVQARFSVFPATADRAP